MPPQLTAEHNPPGFNRPQWVALPLAGEAERRDVAAVRDWHAARLAPAAPKTIIGLLRALAENHYGERKFSEGMWHDFVEDLGEFGEGVVRDAIRDFRRVSKWWPKPAELRTLCLAGQWHDQMMLRRARVLLGEAQPRYYELPAPSAALPPPDDNVVPIDRARIERVIEESAKRLASKPEPRRQDRVRNAPPPINARAVEAARERVGENPALAEARDRLAKMRGDEPPEAA